MLGQVNECLNLPENTETYEFKDREVKMFRPRYDPVTGYFQGLYETLGYIMVRGDADQHFLCYGYSKQNSKILHSYHKKRMPNIFSGTFFNRFRIQYESSTLQTNFSKIEFFLPSITDRVEDINRHMCSFNLLPIDISKDTFEVDGVPFDPFKLDYDNPDKEKMSQTIVKMLKKVVHLFNANLVTSINGLLVDQGIACVSKEKKDCRIIVTRCLTDFFQFVNRLWIFHLKFWLLFSPTWHLMILWKLLLSVKYFITYQGKINYLLRKFVCLSFSSQLFVYLKDVSHENLHQAKYVIMNRLYYSVLPFHVWNHLFLCERSQHLSNMCEYCTKLYIKNKIISDHINDKLYK